jgi:hypothetical protein
MMHPKFKIGDIVYTNETVWVGLVGAPGKVMGLRPDASERGWICEMDWGKVKLTCSSLNLFHQDYLTLSQESIVDRILEKYEI